MLGIQDCLTKGYGSTNPKNLVKAVINVSSSCRPVKRLNNSAA
jgi:ribosomal protein S5